MVESKHHCCGVLTGKQDRDGAILLGAGAAPLAAPLAAPSAAPPAALPAAPPAVDKDCSGCFGGNCLVLMVMRFLCPVIPDSPLIQTNAANEVLPISCLRACVRPGRARPGCLNVMDLSGSLGCRTPGLIELHVPLLSFLLSWEFATNHLESGNVEAVEEAISPASREDSS